MNERSFQPLLPTQPPTPPGGDIVLDFGRIFAILRRGWWIIGAAGFTGALIAAVLVLQVEPTFSAQAQLLMGQKNRSGGVLGALIQDLNLDDDAIAGEIAIITSGRILSKVSAKLDLATRPEFNAALRPPEPEPSLPAQLADQAVDFLKWITGVIPPANESEWNADTPPDPIASAAQIGKDSLGDQADYVDGLERGLRVNRVGNTSLVDVRFTSTDRSLAAAIPNAVVNVYLEDQLDRKFAALRRVTGGLQSRLENMRERLEISERAVIDYRNRNLSEGFGGSELLNQQIGDLSRRLSQVSAEQAELASDLAGVDALIEERGLTAAAGLFQSDLIEGMQSQIAELRQRRNLMLERFGTESSQVRNVTGEIERLEAAIAEEVQRLRDDKARLAELSAARVDALRDQLRALETRAIEQAEREVRLTQLERDYAAEQTVYNTFLDKFTETSEALDLQEGDAQIVAYADPPPSPIAPNKKLAVMLGGIAGAFAGTGLVFLRTLTDSRVRSTSLLRSLMRSGHVFVQPRTQRRLLHRVDPLTVAAQEPFGLLSESVLSLRSHLMLSVEKETEAGQVVAFVSTRTDCGKTTTSLLLARSVAQMGISCVVVDADLRRPSVAGLLGLPARPDIVDVLDGTMPLKDALHEDPDSKARILGARTGLGDPAGLLLSNAMGDLLTVLRRSFRMVIIDTAPLMPVSDAAPLVRMADNVVLMVRYGLPSQEVESGLEMISKFGVRQTTAILSMAPRSSDKTYSYYYPNA